MTTQLVSIHTTLMIETEQVDICYHFPTSQLQIFVNGEVETDWHFNPARTTFNQVNMSTIAVTVWEKWKKKKTRDLKHTHNDE